MDTDKKIRIFEAVFWTIILGWIIIGFFIMVAMMILTYGL